MNGLNSELLVTRTGNKVTLTLNRPKQLNSINESLQKSLFKAINDIADDDTVKLVILKGTGSAFSSGADVKGKSRLAKYVINSLNILFIYRGD